MTTTKHTLRRTVLGVLAFTLAFALATAGAGAAPLAAQYVEGEVLVTFRPTADPAAVQQTLGAHGLTMARHFAHLSAHRHRPTGLLRAKNRTTAALIAALGRDPAVETVEPNYLRWPTTSTPPDDPYFPQLWGLENTGQTVNGAAGTAGADLQFREAWSLARPGGAAVVVAVIDTGVDYTHPDLASSIWTNPGEIAGNGFDDDQNGYADDYYGYDFADSDPNPADSSDHGTHIAGTIAATGNNQVGLIGVDYRARIMALRASSNGTDINDAAVIEAIQYATLMKQRGVNIVAINASFGGAGFSSAERAAIQAAGDAGIVFCAAAGNNSANNDVTPLYPASYRLPNMIVVAASDQHDALASFSSFGATTVDLAAPGVNIFSALPVALAGTTSWVQRAAALYPGEALTFSGITTGITAIIYDCGLGYPAEFPAAVNGQIALIKRGTLLFSQKVGNAMAAGARATIIDNNTNGLFLGTLAVASNWIPSIALSLADGAALRATGLPATGTVVNQTDPTRIYQYLDGTSMATPQVAGAVAFAAGNFPSETVTQRVHRLLAHVDVIAALHGLVATGGRLNLLRLVDTNANGLPDWWEQDHFGQTTVDPAADPDHDGLANAAEFAAGTDPLDPASAFHAVAAAPAPSGFQLTWTSVPGITYTVLYAADPAGPWLILQSNVSANAGATTSYTDTTAAAVSRRFYRVLVSSP